MEELSPRDISEEVNNPKCNTKHASEALYDLFKPNKPGEDGGVSTAHAQVQHPLVKKAIRKLNKTKDSEGISVKDLHQLNKRFMSGHLPRKKSHHKCDDSDTDDDEDNKEIPPKVTGMFAKLLVTQIQLVTKARDYALKYGSKVSRTWLRNIIPTNQIVTLASFLVYTYILNAQFLSIFIPLALFCVGFIVMIVSTLRSVRGESRFKEFVAWSNLLTSLDTVMDVVEAEDNYFKNHISPFVSMPFAALLTVMSFAICPQDPMPKAEIALTSLGLCVTSLVSFKDSFYWQSYMSFAFQIVASLLESFNRFSSDVAVVGLSFEVMDGVMIHFNLAVLFRIAALALAISLPFHKKFRSIFAGIMRGLAPWLFVAIWWELFSLFFHYTTVKTLTRAGMEVFLLLFSLPSAILIFGYGLFKYLLQLPLLKIFVVVTMLGAGYFVTRISRAGQSLSSRFSLSKLGPAAKIMVYTLLLLSGLMLFVTYSPAGSQVFNSSLTWDNYQSICHNNEASDGNEALTKQYCHHLNGHHINWAGNISNVRIVAIENKFEAVANVLPSYLSDWLSCTFGDEFPSQDYCKSSLNNKMLCAISKHNHRECNLERYNKYQFSFVAEMLNADQTHGSIRISASNKFKDLAFHLRPGMTVRYSGLLNADAGEIKLNKLNILEESSFKVRISTDETMSSMVEDAISALLRFLFSPFITFESAEADEMK
ncbi:unnamed protein product [Clavelina lepadiformis]|uniref:Wolframin n=1 Tax=Clavelina lepadiformis TaxID=159417 RepID=A0ABP0GQB8_CLALP